MKHLLTLVSLAGLAAIGVLQAGCSTEAYCFTCGETVAAASGGSGGHAGSGGGGKGGGISLAGSGGAAGSGGGIQLGCGDTDTDPLNCGACDHACVAENAIAACAKGHCQYTCAPGFYDLDGDLAKPQTDGCEYSCATSSASKEVCNGVDDDCNGKVDDGNVCNDAQNCGTFGKSCVYPHGVGVCQNGTCNEASCSPGYYPDPTKPMPNCLYACTPTNGGKEICDGKDNDCNGKVDDKPDVSSDPLHCGACDKTCLGAFANAAPTCKAGACVLGACIDGYLDKDGDPSNGCEYSCKDKCSFPFATGVCQVDGSCTFGKCLIGHYDLNGDPTDGCEYACQPTNGGVEICDGLDNDCNGTVDDGFDVTSDPKNCGACGNVCDAYFPHSVTACQASTCTFVSCATGYVATGPTAAGCQYMCTPTNGGVEICDGLDNDCNGVPDDNLTGTGAACDTGMPGVCQAGTVQCANGAMTCVQITGASPEVCDGLDNDCNGNVDDGSNLPGVGAACGTSQVGACHFGTTSCSAGAIVCVGAQGPASETCNGVDDDCNGVIDDAPTDAGGACGSTQGVCTAGVNVCSGGALVCMGGVKPGAEICDGATAGAGKDENCDGNVDEGCVFATAAPARLDTLNSTQGQYSTFSPSTASATDDFVIAYADERSGAGDIYVRASTNGGTSWGANDVAAIATASIEVEPHVILRKGRAYVVHSRFAGSLRRIYVASSPSPYTTWGAPVLVQDPGSTSIDCYSPTGVVAKADASGTNDWVAAVWSEIAGTAIAPTRNIRLSYSKNGGATWTAPLLVNAGAGQNVGELPVVATDGNGVVYVVWRDKRIAGLAQAYFAKIDLNATTPAVGAFQALQPNVANASAEQISIAADGANVHVAWTDLRSAAKTIRVASSNDGGATWSKVGGQVDGRIVVDAAGQVADAAAPAIAARASSVIVAWEDTRSGKSDIRFARSDDGGATWPTSNPRVDTGDGLGATSSFTPAVAFGVGSHVFATWQDLRYPQAAILAGVSLDGGATWQNDAGLYRCDVDTPPSTAGSAAAANSQLPSVLASSSANQASVTWLDYRDATGQNGLNGDVWSRLLH